MDVLNRILGRTSSSSPAPTSAGTAPEAEASRPGTPSLGPQVVRATPGALGYLDYSLAWRFHPLCRSLHIDEDETRKPLWVKPEEVQPLVSPQPFLQARREDREKITRRLEQLRDQHRRAQAELNRYPASAAAALSKIAPNAPAPRRKQAEDEYYAGLTNRQAEVQRLADAIFETSSQRTESMDRSDSLRDFYSDVIQRDLDQALEAELAERKLSVILNVPWQQDQPAGERRYTKAPRQERNLNSLNHFFDAPVQAAGDQDIAGKYLGRWLDQSWNHKAFFPASIHRLGVVKGGVEITASVVERIWRKYDVEATRIQILRTFLAGNRASLAGGMD